MKVLVSLAVLVLPLPIALAQGGGGGGGGGGPNGGGGGGGGRPNGGGGGNGGAGRPNGGGGGRERFQCSTTEQFHGTPSDTPRAAPLRGNVGCVDLDALTMRDLNLMPINRNQDGVNIFGPMEAGFSNRQPKMTCLGDNTVSGGIDTNLAEHIVHYLCDGEEVTVLDACGGHAMPYHYHERMSCLYEADPTTKHSTRIGTAGDGNGIYGKHINGGVEPDDLDACGGRFGVTPDSNGEVVYYYPITSAPPFSIGCYGPVSSVQECRDLYPRTCGRNATIETVTTIYGSGQYTLDCPCFDKDQSNVIGQGRPGYLEPLVVPEPEEFGTTPTNDDGQLSDNVSFNLTLLNETLLTGMNASSSIQTDSEEDDGEEDDESPVVAVDEDGNSAVTRRKQPQSAVTSPSGLEQVPPTTIEESHAAASETPLSQAIQWSSSSGSYLQQHPITGLLIFPIAMAVVTSMLVSLQFT